MSHIAQIKKSILIYAKQHCIKQILTMLLPNTREAKVYSITDSYYLCMINLSFVFVYLAETKKNPQ